MKKYTQLSLFIPEFDFATKILDTFNNLNTIYRNTFYISEVNLSVWEHINSNKRNLEIIIKSNKVTGFDNTAFTQFNENKDNELQFIKAIEENDFLKRLNKDKDFSISITPIDIYIFYHKFDYKKV